MKIYIYIQLLWMIRPMMHKGPLFTPTEKKGDDFRDVVT